MRGKKAKLLRSLVYGEETSRQRSYFKEKGIKIVADKKRRTYKNLKQIYNQIRGLSTPELQTISDGLKS